MVTRGSDSFSYDQANRLKSATVRSVHTFVYDGYGKRTSATFGTNPVANYVYDASQGLSMLLVDGTRKYVWGAKGLAYETDLGGNVQAVPLVDGLGSVRALTDASGALIQTYRTDPFGVPTATQGTSVHPFSFSGEQSDPTGLQYLRARMNDPQTGRFLQRDTVFGSLTSTQSQNRFVYVTNNPTRFADASGLHKNEAGGGLPGINCFFSIDPREHCITPKLVPGPTPGTPLAVAGDNKDLQQGEEEGDPSAGRPHVGSGPILERATRSLDEPESLGGATPSEITRKGGGTRYADPNKPGDQIRVMPGNPDDPNPAKQGPYVRISRRGKVSDPIPLQGNPMLNQ